MGLTRLGPRNHVLDWGWPAFANTTLDTSYLYRFCFCTSICDLSASSHQVALSPMILVPTVLLLKQSGTHCFAYKTAVLTFKIRTTAKPACLSCHLRTCHSARHLPSSGTPLLSRPSTWTHCAARGFRHSAPAVWNSLPTTVLDSPSLTVFKSRLKTHSFYLANTE